MKGVVTLGDLRGRHSALSVACGKCERQGRYRLDNLIRQYGASCTLPDLAGHLSKDCPSKGSLAYDRCQVYFPDLAQQAREGDVS